MVRKMKQQRGQGMTEYIAIVALVGLGSLAAFSFFGQSIRSQTAQMSDQIAGNQIVTGQTDAVAAAASATAQATSKIDLGTYQTHGN